MNAFIKTCSEDQTGETIKMRPRKVTSEKKLKNLSNYISSKKQE